MNELVHDAEPEGPLSRLRLAREDQVERRPDADQPGQPLAATGAREDSELHFGQPELRLRVIGRDPIVASEGELETAAETGPVDPRGDRLWKAGHALEHLLPFGRETLSFGRGRERDEFFDVRTGNERVGLPGKERHRLDRAVALERFQRGEEIVLNRAGDLVDGLALQIDGDEGDAVGDLPGER